VHHRHPTVADLFCGAGGFSEGFRQAGFKVLWAIDNWPPAYETFRRNFPDTKIIDQDVMALDFSKLPPTDVIIGSPPCTHFSLANKAGNGAVAKGLALIGRFIDAIESLKPRYWIMENVPNLAPIMEREYGSPVIEKYFPERIVLNSAEFGIPQTRRRLFSGKFPASRVRSMRSEQRSPLRSVLYALPYPLHASEPRNGIVDPLYHFTIPAAALADHLMDTTLDRTQTRLCIREKLHHRWAGPMQFPDSIDQPSRTITATQCSTGRHTIVVADNRGRKEVLRRLTIRESACIQGFPITFQFLGKTVEQRYNLVGNAVAPPLARILAKAILDDMELPFDSNPVIFMPQEKPSPVIVVKSNRKRFPLMRSFRGFVPGTLPYSRVDLDNRGNNAANHPAERSAHLVEWEAVFYLGYARDYVAFKLDLPTASRIATYVCLRTLGSADIACRVVSNAAKEFSTSVPDATTLQGVWAGRIRGPKNPEWILTRTAHICRNLVRQAGSGKHEVGADECAAFLRPARLSGGKDSDKDKWMQKKISLYTANAAVAVSIAALFANRGVTWLANNWSTRFVQDPAKSFTRASMRRTGISLASVLSVFSAARKSLPRSLEPLVLASPERRKLTL
jgi:DNA (cytosine-5)-methyltransferase 1